VLGIGGGSLGSSVSHGLSSAALSTRRPGSLVIGATQMSKSSSEPMNLITDTADDSPVSGQPAAIVIITTMTDLFFVCKLFIIASIVIFKAPKRLISHTLDLYAKSSLFFHCQEYAAEA